MATLSTTAWVLHDLGVAAGFGGNLFGKLALDPAVKTVQSERERGKVVHVAWDRYKIVNAVSLAAMATTWLVGRTMLSGREVGRASRGLVLAKDLLVGGAVVSGVAAMVLGSKIPERAGTTDVPIESGAEPSPRTPRSAAAFQRATNVASIASVVLEGAVLAATTILAMKAGKSTKWSFLSELLP